MRLLEIYIGGAFGLILVYLLVANASNANQIIGALGSVNTSAIRALQGR